MAAAHARCNTGSHPSAGDRGAAAAVAAAPDSLRTLRNSEAPPPPPPMLFLPCCCCCFPSPAVSGVSTSPGSHLRGGQNAAKSVNVRRL